MTSLKTTPEANQPYTSGEIAALRCGALRSSDFYHGPLERFTCPVSGRETFVGAGKCEYYVPGSDREQSVFTASESDEAVAAAAARGCEVYRLERDATA